MVSLFLLMCRTIYATCSIKFLLFRKKLQKAVTTTTNQIAESMTNGTDNTNFALIIREMSF